MEKHINKKQLRDKCLSLRSNLSKKEREEYSKIITTKLESFIDKKCILSYYPFNNEVDVTSFNKKYHTCYPVIIAKHIMEAYYSEDNFVLNKYGIYEPDISVSTKINPEDIDIIIIPCLGFNKDRYRLGYGGGFYDNYLKDIKTKKIGVAFDIQRIDSLTPEIHDIQLDMIITETNIY